MRLGSEKRPASASAPRGKGGRGKTTATDWVSFIGKSGLSTSTAQNWQSLANVNRRHLTKGQRAMVVARICSVTEQSIRSAAKKSSLSSTRIANAITVIQFAPDQADAVLAGSVSLDEAYRHAQDAKAARPRARLTRRWRKYF